MTNRRPTTAGTPRSRSCFRSPATSRNDPRLVKPGQTFVWTVTALPDGGSSTSTVLMNDPVKPCVLVPDGTSERSS